MTTIKAISYDNGKTLLEAILKREMSKFDIENYLDAFSFHTPVTITVNGKDFEWYPREIVE